jgi:uncharacterized membrane protein YagU involved in acid resistance
MQSLKFEHKLYASVKEKMEEMQQHNMSWIEVIYIFSYSCIYTVIFYLFLLLCFADEAKGIKTFMYEQHLGNVVDF